MGQKQATYIHQSTVITVQMNLLVTGWCIQTLTKMFFSLVFKKVFSISTSVLKLRNIQAIQGSGF